MAAPQNSLLSRTRSARVPASTTIPGKTLTASSDAPIRSLNISSANVHVQTASTSSAGNLSIFLTNLRLLDLDLLPDWPDINALTFTNKDVAQGQKKRIQCVEWALYQLFSIWDPTDAQNVRGSSSRATRWTHTLTA